MDRSTEQLHDEWLILRCQGSEADAFTLLVERFEPGLLYYARKLIGNEQAALDVMQDVWMRVFRNLRKLREPAAARSWFYRMVHGSCVDSIRRRNARRRAETTAAERADELEADVDDTEFNSDDAAMIHAALDQLNESHREVLVLFFLESFSEAEIAVIIDVPKGTVKSRLHHAKRAMRTLLEKSSRSSIL